MRILFNPPHRVRSFLLFTNWRWAQMAALTEAHAPTGAPMGDDLADRNLNVELITLRPMSSYLSTFALLRRNRPFTLFAQGNSHY